MADTQDAFDAAFGSGPAAPASTSQDQDAFSAAFGGSSAPTARNGKAAATMPFRSSDETMASLPFGKDIMALTSTGLDYLTQGKSPGYHQNLADINAAQSQYETEHPLAAAGAGLTGLLLSAPAEGAAIPQGLTRWQQFKEASKAGAKLGAAYGGLTGLGTAGGDVETRLENAGEGALAGGAIGGLIPAGISAATSLGRGVANAASYAGSKVGLIASNPLKAAEDLIMQKFHADAIDPQAAAQQIEAQSGKPLSILDVGGENTQGLGRRLVTDVGAPRQKVSKFLEDRADEQTSRVLGDIKQHLSTNTNVYETADNLVKQRSKDAKPLWDAAMNRPPVVTKELESAMEQPEIQAGLKHGITLARRNAYAAGEEFDPNAYGITGFNEAGDPIIGKTPTWKTWQAAKEGLDDMIEKSRDPVTRQLPNTKEVNSLKGMRAKLVGDLDAANLKYKAARAAWAGPSESLDAMNMGEKFLRADPEEIGKAFNNLSDSDKDFYRIGAARALQDRVNGAADNADATKRIFGNPAIRAQIETVFGKDASDAFAQAMNAEKAIHGTKQFVMGGSQSINKLAEVTEHPGQQMAQEAAMGLMAGGLKGAAIAPVWGAIRRKVGDLFPHLDPAIADHVAGILTETGHAASQRLSQMGEAYQKAQIERLVAQQKSAQRVSGLSQLMTLGAAHGAQPSGLGSPQ